MNMKRTFVILSFLTSLTVGAAPNLDKLTLEQAVQIALQNHRSVQVSQAALEMAEAQYRQAMAAFGPRVNLEGGFQRADQDRTFTFNGIVQTPSMGLPIGPGGVVVPIPGQPLPINLDVKMFDRDVSKVGNRMALANIRERLTLYYDLEARLETNEVTLASGLREYRVHIVLPCRSIKP